jgi:hypothetical protein
MIQGGSRGTFDSIPQHVHRLTPGSKQGLANAAGIEAFVPKRSSEALLDHEPALATALYFNHILAPASRNPSPTTIRKCQDRKRE